MNMRMPGFTADPAVYASSGLMYGMAGAMDAPAQGAVVVPQQTGIGCFNRTFSVGPFSLTLRCCALPPRCCLRACAFGICRSFCIP
jgi:hypothetical protein